MKAGGQFVMGGRPNELYLFRIPDEMWERICPLIRAPATVHRFGGARRVPDRVVLDGIFFVLRTGCQWDALDATGICSGGGSPPVPGVREGRLLDALRTAALADYDAELGLDRSFVSIDGSMGKARWEAVLRARTRPTAASSVSSAA